MLDNLYLPKYDALVSPGAEIEFENSKGERVCGKIMEISENGHCWVMHGNRIDAVHYDAIHLKRML